MEILIKIFEVAAAVVNLRRLDHKLSLNEDIRHLLDYLVIIFC
jgi:hypothetical protein